MVIQMSAAPSHGLPFLAATTGRLDECGALCHVFTRLFSGDKHPLGMPFPSLFLPAVRNGAPQTLM